MPSDPPREPPWPPATETWHTYNLHCHCGAIRLTMKISPPLYTAHAQGKGVYPVIECNCSHCERTGTQAVHPLAENVSFTQGLEDRGEYLSGNKRCPHWFCRKCGCAMGTDLTALTKMMGTEPRYTINVRMLKDYDAEKLTTKKMEFMKNMPPKYSID